MRFTLDVEASVYRIAQEALNNVAKHACASSVNVLLELRSEMLTLVVEDDGRGLPPVTTGETMIGLTGMRERALALGGTLEFEPTPGGGTTVVACIPTTASREQRWVLHQTDSRADAPSGDRPEFGARQAVRACAPFVRACRNSNARLAPATNSSPRSPTSCEIPSPR